MDTLLSRFTARLAVVLAIAILAVFAVQVSTSVAKFIRWLYGSGCSAADDRLIPAMESLAVLNADSSEVTPKGNVRSGCYWKDGHVYASRLYRVSGSRSSAVAYIERMAMEDGWRRAAVSSDVLDRVNDHRCFAKSIGSAHAYLQIWFPSDDGVGPSDELSIDINATHNELSNIAYPFCRGDEVE